MNWTFDELKEWDDKICKIGKKYNLDWHPISYEICNYHDMIGYMAYTGMPTHYHHWSYGKSFERTHQMYNLGMEGLPYEMIINSNPSISYLMTENPMSTHVLTMAHCIGHSDFFKNNRMFKHTDPDNIISRFKNASKRVKKYVDDPNIGIDAVEQILDAAHALKFQMTREFNVKKLSEAKLREKYIKKINENSDSLPKDFDINQLPLEPNYNILEFIRDHSRNLEHWEKDLLTIVSDEGSYFIPQAMTKIMNEGWASFWHYKILHELDLPQAYHMSFLKLHNQVIRPIVGRLNPYHLGFTIFMWIEKNLGLDHCFIARESHNDESFIRKYLNEEICRDLNLFTYSKKRTEWSIDDISDDDGWKDVRNELVKNVGLGSLPKIFIKKVEKNHTLILGHDHDGRDLDLNYANKVCEHIVDLWGDDVKLFTIIEEELFEI